MRNPSAWQPELLPVVGIWVREDRTTPRGEKPIEWLLWTNHPVQNAADVAEVIRN
jgi:hypothetical protein